MTGDEGEKREFSIKDIVNEEANFVQNKIFVAEPAMMQEVPGNAR